MTKNHRFPRGRLRKIFSIHWKTGEKCWFFGEFSGTSFVVSRVQGGRQDTPPSERGVARPWMGCSCLAKDKQQGPRRGEYCGEPSHQGRFHTGNKRSKPFADASCSSMHRRQAAVLLPPPFSFAPKSQSRSIPSTGRHPPLGGGGCLRTLHSPNTAPQAHHHHSRPLKSQKNQNFSIHWKKRPEFSSHLKKFFHSLENFRGVRGSRGGRSRWRGRGRFPGCASVCGRGGRGSARRG